MPDELRFFVAGDPVPKARPRVVNGHAHTPARTKAWEETIAWKAHGYMLESGLDIFTGALQINMVFFYGNRRADLDNLVKAVWDALNGIVWQDDVQIVQMSARVYRGCVKAKRGVSVEVSTLPTDTEIERPFYPIRGYTLLTDRA